MRMSRLVLGALVAACLAPACDEPAKPPLRPAIDSPAALVAALETAYEARDAETFATLLAAEPGAEFTFESGEPNDEGVTSWGVESELLIHRRMFRPDAIPAGEGPIDPDLHLQSARVEFGLVTDFAEQPAAYFDPVTNPQGVDRERWRALEGVYDFSILFDLAGNTDYLAGGRASFVVLEDLTKAGGEGGRYVFHVIRELQELSGRSATAGVEQTRWASVKQLWAGASPIRTPDDVARKLVQAYSTLDLELFTALLSDAPGAEYRFVLNEPNDDSETGWEREIELRIHQRMFRPQDIATGDSPLDPDLWVTAITAQATVMSAFVERPDLYRSELNPHGVDAVRWRVLEGTYRLHGLFELHGNTDYLAVNPMAFQVLEDRRKLHGTPGKFRLMRWEELQEISQLTEARGWGVIKSLFR